MSNAKVEPSELELLSWIVGTGPIQILEKLATPAEAEVKYKSYNTDNAREFLIFQSLVEVQRAGIAMEQWPTLVDYSDVNRPIKNADKVVLATLVPQQSVWRRKLVEILLCVIGFEETNELQYYHHYLLLTDLARVSFRRAHQSTYFGSDSTTLAARMDELKATLALLQSKSIDLSRCWYLKSDKRTARAFEKTAPHQLLASAGQLVQQSLRACTPAERRALGYCYEHAFSAPSEAIHFNPLPNEHRMDLERAHFEHLQCAFLAAAILVRCQKLSGIHPSGGSCARAGEMLRSDSTNPFYDIAKPGDFVVVTLDPERVYVAEVFEVRSSSYGYESYGVEYLHERPYAHITRDHVMPDLVHLILRGTDARNTVVDRLNAVMPPGTTIAPSKLRDVIRDSVVDMWTNGIRQHFLNHLERYK
jgi:hypothetical protein